MLILGLKGLNMLMLKLYWLAFEQIRLLSHAKKTCSIGYVTMFISCKAYIERIE